MKINWKILIAAALMVIVAVWAVDSLRPRSYSGTDLNFAVGRGTITVNNPSDTALPVQLTGTGTRIFTVQSQDEALRGSSARQGSGRNVNQLLDFTLPTGLSTFTIVNGSGVNLVATSTVLLEATVQSMSGSESTTVLAVTVVVLLGAAFYIFRASGRSLTDPLQRRSPVPATMPTVSTGTTGGQGQALRAYGDNRADISEKS